MTDELTPADVARQLAQGTRMVVDLADQDWQMAAMLILSAIDEDVLNSIKEQDIVALTTNVAGHAGRWLNGRVPMPVLNVMYHERPFWKDVLGQYEKIMAVMYPEQDNRTGAVNASHVR